MKKIDCIYWLLDIVLWDVMPLICRSSSILIQIDGQAKMMQMSVNEVCTMSVHWTCWAQCCYGLLVINEFFYYVYKYLCATWLDFPIVSNRIQDTTYLAKNQIIRKSWPNITYTMMHLLLVISWELYLIKTAKWRYIHSIDGFMFLLDFFLGKNFSNHLLNCTVS